MPNINHLEFSYREVAEALIRSNDIHEGYWGISIKFGIQATNVSLTDSEELTPAAIIPVLKLGLQRFDKTNNLAVDASQVNPVKQRRRSKK